MPLSRARLSCRRWSKRSPREMASDRVAGCADTNWTHNSPSSVHSLGAHTAAGHRHEGAGGEDRRSLGAAPRRALCVAAAGVFPPPPCAHARSTLGAPGRQDGVEDVLGLQRLALAVDAKRVLLALGLFLVAAAAHEYGLVVLDQALHRRDHPAPPGPPHRPPDPWPVSPHPGPTDGGNVSLCHELAVFRVALQHID